MTPLQFKMARAALNLPLRVIAQQLKVPYSSVNGFEQGDEHLMSPDCLKSAETYFNQQGVFFGPKDGVCLGRNVFSEERRYSTALYQILKDHGIYPSMADLAAAELRASSEPPVFTEEEPMPTWVIVSPKGLFYVGFHKDEKDTWKTALGWPSEEEIEHHKSAGWYAAQARTYWTKP